METDTRQREAGWCLFQRSDELSIVVALDLKTLPFLSEQP
jgi:hypothetical protein